MMGPSCPRQLGGLEETTSGAVEYVKSRVLRTLCLDAAQEGPVDDSDLRRFVVSTQAADESLQGVDGEKAKKSGAPVRTKLWSGAFGICMMELCCDPKSALSSHVQEGCLAVRITASMDITARTTMLEVLPILLLGAMLRIAVHLWVAIPCTAGCRWKFDNDGIGASPATLR